MRSLLAFMGVPFTVRFDPGLAEQIGVLGGLRRQECGELAWAHGEHFQSHLAVLLSQCRLRYRLIDGSAHPRGDLGRKVGGADQGAPLGRLVIREAELGHGRHVGKHGRALRAGDGERAHATGFDVDRQRQDVADQDRNLTAEQVVQGRRGPAIRRVVELDVRRRREQCAGEVRTGADAAGAIGERAGIVPRRRDQLPERLDRAFRQHREGELGAPEECNRRDVPR
jgi:hypothetical protein